MNFNLQRHCRIAGSVVILLGWILHNLSMMILGNLIWIIGYMWSVVKIEKYVEEQTEAKENTKDE